MADQSARRDVSDDEIDIGALIARVWATKGRVLIAMFIVAAAFAAFLATRYLASDKVVTYRQAFDLTFEGLSDGEFPDGSPFLISDIIGPTVLGAVHRENDLGDQGVSLDDFRRAINIEPYAPDYFLIRQSFQQRLNNRNLDATEISELQSQMRNELKAATSSSVRISLQLPEGALTTAQAQEILKDIPQAWARRAIEEKGVLRLNLPIYSARIFDEQRFEKLDYLVGIELLLKNINLIQQNITALKGEPNATSVTDDQTGYTLEDLQKAIQDVAEYDLRQLIDPVKELGLARDPEFVKLFYNSRLQDLRLEKQLWQQRAEVTRQVLSSYSGESGSTVSGQSASAAPNTMAPQLGDAFLDRLLEVSRQGDTMAYRQELTRQILEYENNALDVDNQIAEIQLTLDSLNQSRGESNETMSTYVQEVQERLPEILETLSQYTEVVSRIHEKLGRQAIGTVSELIQPQGGSFEEINQKAVTNTDIKVLIALLVLTLFAAVFISLVVDIFRDRRLPNS